MPIEGDFQELSLAGLSALLCAEGKPVVMRLWRFSEEGTVYFEGGAIVHASVGLNEGADAFLDLLDWRRAAFNVRSHGGAPKRSIHADLTLLLEESKRRGKFRTQPFLENPLLRAKKARETLEPALVLLSELEPFAGRVAQPEVEEDPSLAFDLLADACNRVIAFCEVHGVTSPSDGILDRSLGRIGESIPEVRFLNVLNGRVSPREAVNLFNHQASEITDPDVFFRQLVQAQLMVIYTYFAYYGDTLQNRELRKDWEEASGVFLTDLSRNAERITVRRERSQNP